MPMKASTLRIPSFTLSSGQVLEDVPVAYAAAGTLNATCDNVIIVCHALTGDHRADQWWGPLIGPHLALDTTKYFVICLNVIGSPYGTLSSETVNPRTGVPYGPDFPAATIRDTVRLHSEALKQLGVRGAALAIGGSMGGMQVLEWAFMGRFVRRIMPIAVGAAHSAWCIAWSEAQRGAIRADARWKDGHYTADAPPRQGLAAARMMAMVSYRTAVNFESRFGRETMPDATSTWAVSSYLSYQGEKLVNRFDARCYVNLTYQMDTHDVARGRGATDEVLGGITQPTLVVGITSDLLYPLSEQEALADAIPGATLATLDAPEGHDAFLVAFDQLSPLINSFLAEHV
jgi:homoserine O-acetyltransferase